MSTVLIGWRSQAQLQAGSSTCNAVRRHSLRLWKHRMKYSTADDKPSCRCLCGHCTSLLLFRRRVQCWSTVTGLADWCHGCASAALEAMWTCGARQTASSRCVSASRLVKRCSWLRYRPSCPASSPSMQRPGAYTCAPPDNALPLNNPRPVVRLCLHMLTPHLDAQGKPGDVTQGRYWCCPAKCA